MNNSKFDFTTNPEDWDDLEIPAHAEFLKIIGAALKDYMKVKGGTISDFEEEYGAEILYDEYGNIKNLTFSDEAGKTALYLKYFK